MTEGDRIIANLLTFLTRVQLTGAEASAMVEGVELLRSLQGQEIAVMARSTAASPEGQAA